MRINFIYVVLFLIFCITVFNLYYKQQLFTQSHRNVVDLNEIPFAFNPFDKLFCPINGFKCPDDTCDCSQYCKGNYEKIHIYDEELVLFHEKLKNGTYCLPKGALQCHLKSSMPVYSVNGWTCVPRNNNVWKNNHFIACQSPYAQTNALNILYDNKNQKEVDSPITDYYEMHNGQMRYQCSCQSKDIRGNLMVALDEVPFTCVPDQCLSNFKNNVQNIGWKVDHCDCGPYNHEIPNDLTTPCIDSELGVKNFKFTGVLKCTNRESIVKHPIYCNENYFTFTKRINFDMFATQYVRDAIE